MPRPKHNNKELEQLLKEAEHKGWDVKGGGNTHFKMFCPCYEKHKKQVSTTPRNQNHEKRVRGFLERHTCWLEER